MVQIFSKVDSLLTHVEKICHLSDIIPIWCFINFYVGFHKQGYKSCTVSAIFCTDSYTKIAVIQNFSHQLKETSCLKQNLPIKLGTYKYQTKSAS